MMRVLEFLVATAPGRLVLCAVLFGTLWLYRLAETV